MIGGPTSSADDRAWRFGAYALATLIHLPLVVAVQQFGAAIAASRPVERVITLLDTPETERAQAIAAGGRRAEPVTETIGTLRAAPIDAARSDGIATPIAVAPVGSSSTRPIPGDEAQSIAALIEADALDAAAPSRPAEASTAAAVPAAPSPTVARTVVDPVPSATARLRPSIVTPTVPAGSASIAGMAVAPVAVAAALPSPAVPGAPVQTAASPDVASSPAAIQPSRPTASTAAPPRSRIAIIAPPSLATRSTATVAPVIAGGSPPTAGPAATAQPAPAVPSARVVSSAGGGATAARAPAAVAAPTAGPIASSIAGSVVSSIAEPAAVVPATPSGSAEGVADPRLAALPNDAGERSAADRSALNAFVRGYEGGGCFAALTVEVAGDDVGVSGFSRDETALEGFAQALGRRSGPRPSSAARKVSEAQCSVLAFARAQPAYPDFPVRLAVTPDRIASGGRIAGRLTGVGDRPATLLILDDEGRIQDASFLLSREPNGDWRFETPLSLTGDRVPTVQLFVALAGDGPIAAMRPPVPVEARRYFVEIARILRSKGRGLDVALAAFTVDPAEPATAP